MPVCRRWAGALPDRTGSAGPLGDDSATSVISFVQEVVESSAVVRTDGSAAYLGLKSLGLGYERKVMLGAEDAAHVSMPGVHRVAALVCGFSARTRARCSPTSLTSIWMNSCSGSIAAPRGHEACCSSD